MQRILQAQCAFTALVQFAMWWCVATRSWEMSSRQQNTIPGLDARAPKGSAAVRISPSVKCMAAGGEEGLRRDKREGTGDDLR
ncbi:hypothetical protein COEREDRAFT_6732 [Coemansia reversa NRRL 1564]|uniref:Uncharacterized protein n=1 Tax=Coemansia reversa (strain ATCC 12441 / NRRL 1564) TaxID=763665 RepID=A0A2G5BHP0_COERN|nr:hypothetical protein COEREDRAFT_6732 [Coemansia reversa NRRL 1564]|eukprot:PIA18501.1 hypothetical protein COEREDRAFT_6732 [Coemansia reversa NRRL 1564]